VEYEKVADLKVFSPKFGPHYASRDTSNARVL